MDAAKNEDNVYREALYIGSFCVEETDHKARIQKVQNELELLRVFAKSKKVLICVSVRGIKICSPNRETVFMAHALRRVSYATCDAAHRQVAFLAREPLSEANLQYCHVFVAPTSSQAEELNRIVGDAFQLAYARQRLLKLRRNGADALSTDIQPIPRLCDRYSPWPNEFVAEPRDSNNNPDSVPSSASLLPLLLELPPPPSCPPPPPSEMDPSAPLAHCSSSPELTTAPKSVPNGVNGSTSDPIGHASANGVSPPVPPKNEANPSTVGHPSNPTEAGDHQNNGNCNNNGCNESNDLENRLRRIATPQVTEMAFLRRHFLRRSEGKRLSTVADTQLMGGSTRQPRRRPGAGLTNLFSQARHSAFFPSTTAATVDTNEADKLHRNQPDTRAQSSDWLSRIGAANSTQRPHIFFDLRTFAGGSPVVALKERLDAQAVADAKASAFAEAAAVLAAAKLASESPNSSGNGNVSANCNSPRANALNSHDIHPIVTSPAPAPCSTLSSNGCKDSGSGLRQQTTGNDDDTPESPPVPPVRLHSLGRGPHRPLPRTPGSSSSNKPLTGRGGFRAEHQKTTCLSEEDVTGIPDSPSTPTSESTASSPGGRVLHNGHERGHSGAPSLPSRSSGSAFFTGLSKSSNLAHQTPAVAEFHRTGNGKGPGFAVSDRRIRNADRPETRRFSHGPNSSATEPLELGTQWTTARSSHRPHEYPPSEPTPGPLHVIAEGCVSSQPWPHGAFIPDRLQSTTSHSVPPPVMSTSAMSAETPTPTATPTPTPSQTPQPFGNQVLISREDCEFLRHAPWYQALLPRELAFELLAREDIGSFLLRNSATHPDCCALSVRVPQQNNPTGITHYLIQRTKHGVRLKGLDKEWPSLRALITHLTVMPEMLPCLLRMPAHSTNPVFTQLDEPRGEWEPALTMQRDGEHVSRSHRVASGPINLQPVTSLPSRPVPPACASRSYFTTVASDVVGPAVNGDRGDFVRSEPHEARSHSIQLPEPPSDLDPVSVVRWKSHSLGTKAQHANEDGGEALCRYDEVTMSQLANSRAQAYNDERWSRPGALSPFEDDEDEDYQRLSDFSSMMADLKPEANTEVTNC